jgi:tetratricopeptide (TPR) repeat protein
MPPRIQLTGLTHMWQTWNNCGPATFAMNLSYFGLRTGQADIAASLRPNKEDKNVSPDELAAFARAQGLGALLRVNGDPDRLRQLLAIGIPVLVETWHEPKPNDGMGHYRLLTGYDDAEGVWIAYDSYDATGIDPKKPYEGIRIPYDQLDPLWTVFNRPYVVVHTDAMAAQVRSIVGEDCDDEAMWQRALGDAQNAVKHDPADAFAWFNMGSDLTALGRYEEAAKAYDKARQIGLPWRMFWYQFGAFRAYYEIGRYEEVVALANATLRTARYVEELYYWRGLAQRAQGKIDEARASFLQALEMNRNFAPASEALDTLPAQ